MTTQQNNVLINLMLNGELVSHFGSDNNEIMAYIFNKVYKWIFINEKGKIVKAVIDRS